MRITVSSVMRSSLGKNLSNPDVMLVFSLNNLDVSFVSDIIVRLW